MHFLNYPTQEEKDKCANPLSTIRDRPRHWHRKNAPPPPPDRKVLWDTQYGISGWKKNSTLSKKWLEHQQAWAKNQPLIVKRSNHFSAE